MADILVFAAKSEYAEQAQRLAEHLQVDCIADPAMEGQIHENREEGLILRFDDTGLSLCDRKLTMQGDFTANLSRISKGKWQHEMLVKAARIKGAAGPITVVDATAGMGEDSLLLAAAGFEVQLFERDPVIAALLEDSLRRAKDIPELEDVLARMHFHEGDSVEALASMKERPDVIYLDPMFPERKKSGLIKKKFQLLQQLESPCVDGEVLLAAAMKAKPKKIVIKRPAKGPYLADIKADYSITGKTIRYDCIMVH